MINLPSLNEVKVQTLKTMQRFPLPALCAFIITYLGIYLTHESDLNTPPDWVWQGLMTSMLGLISLTALNLVAETTTKFNRGLIMLGGVLLLGLYFITLPSKDENVGSLWAMRHIFLMLGSFAALSWVPFWRQNISNKILWLWCSQLIASLIVTLFFAIVLFLGLAAALWSIEALFSLNIDEKLYFDIWILIVGLFGPLFFLSQFVVKPEKLKEPKSVSGFMGIFTKYIISPLAVAYMVILYTYTAKILLTGEWPKNVLGWLVIAFLGAAIFAYFLWTPLLKKTWDKYRRIFWLLLLPQIALLFVAIGWRIHAYSWTENRYFVVVLGLWLLGTTLYFLIRKDAKFKWIFFALTTIIFVSQIGPLSGYNIGKTSQLSRLQDLLVNAGVKKPDPLQGVNIKIDKQSENEIASILDYINDRFGESTLKIQFPSLDYKLIDHYDLPEFIMDEYGLNYRFEWERNNDDYIDTDSLDFYTDMQQPLNIAGYDWKVQTNAYEYPNKKSSINGYDFRLKQNDKTPTIKIYFENNLIDTIDVSTKFESLLKARNLQTESIAPEDAVVNYESDAFDAKIYLTNGWQHSGENTRFEAEVYLRFNN